MREFFRGWRRKTGALTLVMACLFMGLWIRSLSCADVLLVKRFECRIYLASSSKGFSLGIRDQEITVNFKRAEYHGTVSWKHIGPVMWITSPNADVVFDFKPVIAPYWWIVVPLTLLSACLILWKPRKRVNQDA